MIPYLPSAKNFSNSGIGGAVFRLMSIESARLGPLSANRSAKNTFTITDIDRETLVMSNVELLLTGPRACFLCLFSRL